MRKIKHYFGKRRSKHNSCKPKWLRMRARFIPTADFDGDTLHGELDFGSQWEPWKDDSVVAVQEKQSDIPLIGKE